MKKTFAAGTLCVSLLGLGACSTVSEPDKVGLYYLQGSSDGYKFDTCIEPGQVGDGEWNNSVVFLPTSLRTWNIAREGGDTDKGTIVSTKPEKDQPSGVPVIVWSTTNFYLNTFCDTHGGTVKEFWEKIGRRYGADTAEGWAKMVQSVLVPVLEKTTQDVVRSYSSDDLVGNIGGVRAEAQQKISALFTEELQRTVGGSYFCGPTFNRAKAECPGIQMLIRDIDFADPGIQDARNAKQKAVELAAAKVAEAQGQVDAAKKLGELYSNKAWLELEKAKMNLEAVKACGANPNCHMVIGADGNVIIQS